MKRKLKNKDSLKKGARRVEAWVYTVINPLIEALKVEKSFLKDKNWTWRYYTKNLEFIIPLEKYVDSASFPNFEDFLKSNPQMERKRKKHEALREALSENCRIAFSHLLALEAFQDKVKSALSIYARENPAEGYPGGAVLEKDFDKIIAQYIINSIKELSDRYSTSEFWSRFRDEFLQFRTSEVFERLDACGEQFENEDERLLTTLENLRSNLCGVYDVPAAPVYYHDLVGQGR